MAVTAELMAIIMNINDQTHKTINFKKRKVMDDFNRNLIINGIFMDFKRNLMGFMCSSDSVSPCMRTFPKGRIYE